MTIRMGVCFLIAVLSLKSFGQTAQGPATGSVVSGVRFSPSDVLVQKVRGMGMDSHRSIPPKLNETAGETAAITGALVSTYQPDLSVTGTGWSPPPVTLKTFGGIPQTSSFPPNAVVAAGRNHIIEMVNRAIHICDKSGALLKSIDPASWFATTLPGSAPFDPRIQYDHFAGRWIMLWHTGIQSDTSSYYLLSVSDGDNPLNQWSNWALPAHVNGMTRSGNWADNGCLGFDSSAVYIISDQFLFGSASFSYVKCRILQKSQLYANNAGSVSWTDFWNFRDQLGRISYHVRPSVVHGSSTNYCLLEVPDVAGTGSFVVLYKIIDPASSPTVSGVPVPVGTWTRPPDAFQPGGGTPFYVLGSTLGGEVHCMDSLLWAVHSAANPVSGAYSAIKYVCINTRTNTTIEDITFGAPGYWYFYPAVAVDKDRNIAISFTRSGQEQYAGAYFTGKIAGNGSAMRPSYAMHAGLSQYEKVDNRGNRWGDYNAAVLDPIDGNTFWFAAEFADSPENTWGTWVTSARFVPAADPTIVSDKPSVEFGDVGIGERSDTISTVIRNGGQLPLVVTGVDVASSAFAAVHGVQLPVSLPTYDSLRLSLVFSPTSAGMATDTLAIQSNDPARSVMKIPLTGRGTDITNVTPGKIFALVDDVSGSALYELSRSTSNANLLGSTGLSGVRTISVRAENRKLYGLAAAGGATTLLLIDADSGKCYPQRSIGLTDVSAIAFNRDDSLYAGTTLGGLYRVNVSTGDAVLAGSSSRIQYAGLAFTGGGRLYASSGYPPTNDTLYLVNVLSGAVSPVGTTGWKIPVSSLSFDSEGKLYGSSGAAILNIDTLTGRGDVVALYPLDGLRAIAILGDTAVSGFAERPIANTPSAYSLSQNYPNPFNPSTTIEYFLPRRSKVRLIIFNTLGQQTATLVDEVQEAGRKEIRFDASRLASGVYFCRFVAPGFTQTRKLLLLR